MNAAQMGGAVLAGFCVAAIGPGWALAICGVGMLGTLPLMLALRVSPADEPTRPACSGPARGLVRVPVATPGCG